MSMKRLISTTLILVSLTAILTTACKKNSDENLPGEPVTIQMTPQQVSIVNNGNSFAFDIFRDITESEDGGKNIMISPMSISVALSMTANGAAGATRTAMLEGLRSNGLTVDEINAAYKELVKALLSVDKRVLISIANSVWTEEHFTAKQSFIEVLEDFYNAQAKSFEVTDPGAKDAINKWIEDNTNGLIKKMIEAIEPDEIMFLINAIYFKGLWKDKFDKNETVLENFNKANNSTVQVSMMKRTGNYKIYQGQDLVMAEFPYGQGNYVMDVILPASVDGGDEAIQNLTPESFGQMVAGLSSMEAEVSFPRFKYGYKKELNDVLIAMGMGPAFSNADFSNIADASLEISRVLHQAFIETNEDGTEAAAATVVGIRLTSMPMNFVLRLDRPFIYIIRETSTNAILFIGRVSDPLAE